MALRFSQLRVLSSTFAVAALAAFGTTVSSAQGVPVPIASTAAGGGTVCAASISTYAPSVTNRKLVGDGCPASQSTLNNPVALAIDRYNNVAIADQTNDLVRIIYHGGAAMAAAITASIAQAPGTVPVPGDIYTIVGGPQSTPSQSTFYCTQTGSGLIGFNKPLDGCPGNYAYVQPRGLAFDNDGNLFISSIASNYGVRVLYVGGTAVAKLIALENPTLSGAPQPGYIYDIAGTGAPSKATGGDGAIAYKATINQPRGLWIDANENVYFTDTLSGLIRRVDGTTGLISTVAGYCPNPSDCSVATGGNTIDAMGDGNPANSSAVRINYPYGEVFDSYGNMFIADSGSGDNAPGRIRVIYAGGKLAGISNPVVGDIYTYAGGGSLTGTQAQQTNFQFVYGVALDVNGYLYINDYRNATSPGSNHVWRVDPRDGSIVSIAGNGGTAAQTAGAFCNGVSGPKATTSRGDGCPAPEAYLNLPQQAPVFDNLGNFYEAERNTNVVRYFSYNNTFPSTAIGSSATQLLAFAYPAGITPLTTTFTGAGASSSDFSDGGNDICALTTATPAATVCTNNVKFTPAAGNTRLGAITTSAATVTLATQVLVGTGSAAQLTIDPATTTALGSNIKPQAISVDAGGHVYISDATSKQVLSTTASGGATNAIFTGLSSPQGTATDSFGNVYVADAGASSVLQRAPNGTITTVLTGLSAPTGMAADLYGDVYVADTGNHRVLRYSALTGASQAVNTYPQTLNAPTALAVDAAGDLFVLDTASPGAKTLLEFPIAALPQTIALPSGSAPTSFALDHAGDLYLADASSAGVLVVAPGGSAQTLLHNLVSPAGIALDAAGDIFLADSGATSATAYHRTAAAASFANTNVGAQSLPAAFTLTSVGDLGVALASPYEVETGNAADFPLAASGNTCSNGLSLAPGSTCATSFVFAPTVKGSRAATATFAPTAGNTVTASLVGVGVFLTPTSLALTQTSPNTATNSYGQTESFTATLTAQTGSAGTPTGTVTFTVDGVAQQPQTLAASGNFYSASLSVGIHIIAVAYSGDTNYASSNNTTSVTVAKSPTATTASTSQSVAGVTLNAVMTPMYTGASVATGTVTFSIDGVSQTPQPVGNGSVSQIVSVADGTHTIVATYSGDGNYAGSVSAPQTLVVSRTPTSTTLTVTPTTTSTTVSLTLAATVKASTGTPTGTVSFYNGATLLGTASLSNGVATLPTAVSTNLNFTATYSGNGIYQPSTTTVAEGPDFAVLQPSAPLAVPQGGQATTTISVVSVAGYTGSLTAACTNLPTNSLCRFQPIPVATSPGVNGNITVQVYVGISPTIAGLGAGARFALLGTLATALFVAWSLRKRRIATLFAVGLLSAAFFSTMGCSQNNAAMTQDQKFITPTGSYPVTVTLTDANNIAHATTLTVQVNSQ